MASTRESILKQYRDAILEGMARTLWILAYADYADEQREAGGDDDIDRPGPGEDWNDYAPETPKAATKAAEALAKLYESGEGDLVELYGLAQETDMGEAFSFGEEYSSEKDSKYQRLDREWKMEGAEEFGSKLAFMGLGTGVSWFDDHKQFDLKHPHFECSYDGEDLTWHGGTSDVREVSGKLGRITIVNASDESWTKHSYVLAFGASLLMAYANSLDDALDECIDWLVENAPGHIIDDQVEEEYHRARSEGLSEEQAQERAEVDTTSGGNAGNHISSSEWTIVAEDPTEEQLQQIAHRKNPAGLTKKGERMYKDIKAGYQAKGEPRAKEIAARTVYARAKKTSGLVKSPRGRQA